MRRFLYTVNLLKAQIAVALAVIALLAGGAAIAVAGGGGSTNYGGTPSCNTGYSSYCMYHHPPRCHWVWKKVYFHGYWIWVPCWVCERW